jgi:hypothetical protein
MPLLFGCARSVSAEAYADRGLEPVAGVGVSDRDDEEAEAKGQEKNVEHGVRPPSVGSGANFQIEIE